MSSGSDTGVLIQYDRSVELQDVAEFQRDLENFGINVAVGEQERGFQNAIEWALPALIFVALSKPFLDGFMGELGADLAKTFKQALRRLHKKVRGKELFWASHHELEAASQSDTPHVRQVGTRGPTLRVQIRFVAEPLKHVAANFVFVSELDDEGAERAITKILDLAERNMEEEKALAQAGFYGSCTTTYVYDDKRAEWVRVH